MEKTWGPLADSAAPTVGGTGPSRVTRIQRSAERDDSAPAVTAQQRFSEFPFPQPRPGPGPHRPPRARDALLFGLAKGVDTSTAGKPAATLRHTGSPLSAEESYVTSYKSQPKLDAELLPRLCSGLFTEVQIAGAGLSLAWRAARRTRPAELCNDHPV